MFLFHPVLQSGELPKNTSFIKRHRIFFVSLIVLVAIIVFVTISSTPPSFVRGTIVTIEKGASVSEIGDILQRKNIIRSSAMFSFVTRVSFLSRRIDAGDYLFSRKEHLFSVILRVVTGRSGISTVLVTVPEGATVMEIGGIFEKFLPLFNKDLFARVAESKEGYLFPDTYRVSQNARENDVMKIMEENFNKKIATIDEKIKAFGKSLKDVVIMASILEEEARTTESRRIIAGILWKRIKVGMPLQVDAPFIYINGKNTYQLTTKDLTVDSPYNTYKYKGLPAGPISNPGLDSILSAITPIKTDYFFYLSDREGNMHYAVTHDGHVVNKRKYIK